MRYFPKRSKLFNETQKVRLRYYSFFLSEKFRVLMPPAIMVQRDRLLIITMNQRFSYFCSKVDVEKFSNGVS